MRNVFLGLLAVLLGVLVLSSVASAQYEQPAAGGRQAPAASTKPFDPKEISTGFTGVWSPTNSGDNLTKEEPPMKPAALAKYKSEKTEYTVPPVGNEENTDPLNHCEPGSVPRFY